MLISGLVSTSGRIHLHRRSTACLRCMSCAALLTPHLRISLRIHLTELASGRLVRRS